MKPKEIDRWMRHQAHLGNEAARPAVNWARTVLLLMIVGALLFILLRTAGVL